MGLSPTITLVGIILMVIIMIVGAIESPADKVQIFGTCTMIIVALVSILKADYVVKKIENNDKKTDDRANEVKNVTMQQAREVRNALITSDANKDKLLHNIAEDVKTVKEQTNGPLSKKIEETSGDLTKKIDEVKNEVLEVKKNLPTPE